MRRVSDFKFVLFSFSNVFRVVVETILELSLCRWFRAIFLRLGSKLLEFETLKVDLLKALHAGMLVLNATRQGTLGDLREACKRLYFKVTSVNEFVDVFLVTILKFIF